MNVNVGDLVIAKTLCYMYTSDITRWKGEERYSNEPIQLGEIGTCIRIQTFKESEHYKRYLFLFLSGKIMWETLNNIKFQFEVIS